MGQPIQANLRDAPRHFYMQCGMKWSHAVSDRHVLPSKLNYSFQLNTICELNNLMGDMTSL